MSTLVATPLGIVTPVTAAATLAAGKHTPVDATAAAVTVTLPAAAAGAHLSVEKYDTGANTVTVAGSIRGAASTIALVLPHESVELVADAAGSWWPIAGHKTLSSLDARSDTVTAGFLANAASASRVSLDARLDSRFLNGTVTPEMFGTCPGDDTDVTALVMAAITAAQVLGGKVVLGNKRYTCLGAIAFAYTGTTAQPKQRPVRITSNGGSTQDGHWALDAVNSGPILDLRYTGVDGLHPAKIDSRGAGFLEIDHITLISGGTDDYPIFQTTNTTVFIHHCAFIGNGAKKGIACVQDAIILGSTGDMGVVSNSPTAPFQGYGTKVHDNYFGHIRRGVSAGAYCNSVPVENNTFSTSCGNATGGAIEFNGQGTPGPGFSVGCSTRGNTIEVNFYKYGIALYNTTCGNFGPDGIWDPSGPYSGAYYVDTTSAYNEVVGGYYPDTYPLVVENNAQTTTIRTAHQSMPSFHPQPEFFINGNGGPVITNAGGSGCMALGPTGWAASLMASIDGLPYAGVTLCSWVPTQFTDAVTTTGSNIITSATANFSSNDVGYPISGVGIPVVSRIVQRLSATSVVINKNATATASGITINLGRPYAVTSQQQVYFSRNHMRTLGTIGAATPMAGAGAGATVTAAGTDMAFTLTLTTGTAPAAGDQCVVAAGINWSSAAKVHITPKNAAAATAMSAAGIWLHNVSANTYLATVAALTASTIYLFDVIAIQ